MPTSPPRHGQRRVIANRLARQKEYNQNYRTNQDFYNSGRWRKLRNWFIKANPLCVDCKETGLVVAGHVVDHITPIKKGGAALSSENLQTLCNYHHNQKTARENGRLINVVIGPPCAGKSTFVNEQIKAGGLRVDFDLLAQALGSTTEHQASKEIKQITIKARYAAITEILKGVDLDAWIIETTPSAKMLRWYKDCGAIFKLIDPGEKICIERAKARGGNAVERVKEWYGFKPDLADII